jgi:uncharacterized protein YhfF
VVELEPGYDADVDDALESFWREAVFRARLNHMPSYFGPTPLEVIRPPAWAFGATAAEADAFVRDVESGRTSALAGPLREYAADGEPLPEAGELGIVVDGSGRPRLLLAVTEVVTLPYAAVGVGAVVEGSGHAADTEMLVQQLRVLHSR